MSHDLLCFMSNTPLHDIDQSKQPVDEELFKRYLDICNQALDANKSTFPYNCILKAAQAMLKDKTITLTLYDDRPKTSFELSLKHDHLKVTDSHAPCEQTKQSERSWRVNMSYLEDVVLHPEEYIKNPAKIDWDWLRNNIYS